MLTLKTTKQETLIVNNIVKACKDIKMLNKIGYSFIHVASGFIAHYDLHGFKAYYSDNSLSDEIIRNASMNQWDNFHPGEKDYEYMMQKKRIYNTILEKLTEQIEGEATR